MRTGYFIFRKGEKSHHHGLGRHLLTRFADNTEAWTLMDQRGQAVLRRQRSGLRAQVFYDGAGRDYHVWEYEEGAAQMVGRHIRASYDLAGRPVWRDVSVQTSSTWSDTHLREVRGYGYDAANRPLSVSFAGGGQWEGSLV